MDITFSNGATLTTDHAASSYGQPVLVIDSQAYGPADIINPSCIFGPLSAAMMVSQLVKDDGFIGSNPAHVSAVAVKRFDCASDAEACATFIRVGNVVVPAGYWYHQP